MASPRVILENLRRRGVIRSGVAYLVGSWLLVEVASVVLPTFDAPDWLLQVVIVVLVIVFPVALTFSYFFDVTADGIVRTEKGMPDTELGPLFHRRVDFVIMGILAASLALSLYGNLRRPDAPPELVSILIADFDNRTGSDLYSGVVEDMMRVSLEVAPFIEAYSRETAAAIAAELRGADADKLSLENASLVALQQSIDVVVGGSIARVGGKIEISVSGLAPGDQRVLFSITETAASDTELLSAIASIGKELRLALGDTEKPADTGASESFVVANVEAAAEYLKAQDLQRDRKLEDAVAHYQNALGHDPEFARAYAGLALTEQYLGRMDSATRNWEEALSRLHTLTERGQLRTLGTYYTTNRRDYHKALETFERLVEKYPADNVAQNNLAVAAFYALDFERALEVGRDVAGRFPDHSGYRANLALYAMYATRFDEASDVAQSLIKDDPTVVYASIVRALTSAISGDTAKAEAEYLRMAGLDQFGRSVSSEGLADLAIYRGDMSAAVAILERGIDDEIAQNAQHAAALKQVMRAGALIRLDNAGEARSAIDIALQHNGGDPAILVPAALALIELGDIEQADSIANDMLKSILSQHRAYANAILSRAAAARGELTKAIDHANDAVASADLWLVRLIRGEVLLLAGRRAEALADLQTCQQRTGEGIAVFLDDRPSLRKIRDLEAALQATESEFPAATAL